jgi:hypothetical protein
VRRALLALGAAALLLAACGEGVPPLPFVPTPEPTPEPPRSLAGRVVDSFSEAPVTDAVVRIRGVEPIATFEDGSFSAVAMRGATVRVQAAGYDPSRAEVPAEGDLVVELRPNVVRGTLTASDGSPIAAATVFVDGTRLAVATAADGTYQLAGVPEDATLVYKAPGFEVAERRMSDDDTTMDVVLDPFAARALYAPASVFEAPGGLDAMLAVLDRTEANAVVIDVKETSGRLYYATEIPEAVEIGAVTDPPIFDLDELLPMLEERGIYTIARVVVMKDNTLGAARPQLAVQDIVTGQPWQDFNGGIWLDPNQPGVGEYAAAIAVELAARGFDEVQLDYIRFFSDGPYEQAATLLPNSQSHRLPGIRRIMRLVDAALETERAFLSADVFPIAFLVPDDQGIGQRPEVVMPYVDYLSPMVYPSHYGPGVFGFEIPNDYPYEVVARSLEVMQAQATDLPMRIRPWLQDFGYGPFAPYTPDQVRAQIQAAADHGALGWMLWNPGAVFSEAALAPAEAGQ